MQGKQANRVSPTQERAMLEYLVTPRSPSRDSVRQVQKAYCCKNSGLFAIGTSVSPHAAHHPFATLLPPAMRARLPELLDTPEARGGRHPGAGNVSVKVVPCPSTLSTVTRPAWATRISWTIYRPKPVPPGLVV